MSAYSAWLRATHVATERPTHCDLCSLRWPCGWLDAADEIDEAEARLAEALAALDISPDEAGQIAHAAWMKIKRKNGFHGPDRSCDKCTWLTANKCPKYHEGLVPWEELSEYWREFDRAILGAIMTEIRRRIPDAARILEQRRADAAVLAGLRRTIAMCCGCR